MEVHPNHLGIYSKPANVGQYTHYTRFTPWYYKRTWISNIVNRKIQIRIEEKL